MRRFLFFALAAFLVTASGCIRNAGPLVTEERSVGDFKSIKLMSAADLIITQDADYELRIQAGENHMKYIETDVNGDVLEIDESRNRVWVNETVKIWISADFLENISILGSGDVEGAGFETQDLNVHIAGSGDVDLSFSHLANSVVANIEGSGDIELYGDTGELDVSITGSGDFDGRQLYAEDVTVDIDGSGDARVWATNSLVINIAGSGDVHYWGNPNTVNTTINGTGDVVKH